MGFLVYGGTSMAHTKVKRRGPALSPVSLALVRSRSLTVGLVFTLIGVVAVATPHVTSLAIDLLIGWLLATTVSYRLYSLIGMRPWPGFGWSLAGALMALAAGLLIIVKPYQGVLTLTAILVALFTVQGIISVITAIDYRRRAPGWIWMAMSGVGDLILALLILQGWPAVTEWALGLLIGVNFLMLGVSLVMLAKAMPTDKSG